MKTKSLIIILTLITNFSFGQQFTDLYGDYLGQTPPGDSAVVFAPGIVSDDLLQHSPAVFSSDGNQLYWWVNRPPDSDNQKWDSWGMTMKRIDNRWTVPEKYETFRGIPVFSKDGSRMSYESPDRVFCFKTKQGNNWSEPVCFNLVGKYPEMKFMAISSVSVDGTFYFFSVAKGLGTHNDYGIYRIKFINGEYGKPELLPRSINLPPFINWTPFIASDESYLIFSSSREGQYGGGDLYISFHDVNTDIWSEPVNMGKGINTGSQERLPVVSPDGKYLFFTRYNPPHNQDVFWVDASIIQKLEQEHKN